MKPVEELGLPELTSEQIEELCLIAEQTARKHIFAKISPKKIEKLNITAEVEGDKPVALTVDIDIELSSSMEEINVQDLADQAVKEAFDKAMEYLRELACHSQK